MRNSMKPTKKAAFEKIREYQEGKITNHELAYFLSFGEMPPKTLEEARQ
jgi:hypothetical protein